MTDVANAKDKTGRKAARKLRKQAERQKRKAEKPVGTLPQPGSGKKQLKQQARTDRQEKRKQTAVQGAV